MRRQHQPLPKRQRGAVAVVVGLTIFVLIGMIGLALDLGQMFVNKTELQNAADACALAAARELDGTADALTRADAAGITVGNRNLVGFQGNFLAITEADIRYAEHLSDGEGSNTNYHTSASGLVEPEDAHFAMCSITRDDIGMWFMGALAFDDQTVRAYAVATLAPSQSTCALPIGMCMTPGSSAPTFGLVVGQWYSGKFGPDGSGTGYTGSYNWIDFSPEDGGGANEIKDMVSGPGQCELPPVGKEVGQQGQIAAVADPWNTRFGLYKGAYNLAESPPDFTGIAYTQAGIGGATETTWPNAAPQNAYAGIHPAGTTANYQSAKAANLPYQDTNPAGINGIGGYSISQAGTLGQYGSQRRVALAPIVDCEALAGTNPQTVTIQGYACILMLNPIKGPDDIVMEYLGDPAVAGSPCSSFGLAGGSAGPLVPVLVQ